MVRSPRRTLLLVVFILVICGFLGMLFGQKITPAAAAGGDSDVRDSLRQFATVYDVVEQNYAEPVNADKAIYNGAIPGMLHVLDPHSNFFDPKSYSLLREDQRGKYYGVGMTVGPRNNKVIVIAPFVGTPAYRAGIHPGDVIIAVDGKPTDNMNTGDVADLLKGPKGTTVHITVLREGNDKPLEFTVVRDEIPRYSVDLHFLIHPGIGYMHVSGFNETTEKEVQDALDSFYQAGDLKGLILDLRQNPGGLLNEGVGVADKSQRDYSNVSLYDYYFDRDGIGDTTNKEVKLTDSGRTVYGGGGISPDVKVDPIKSNHFQDSLLQHYAFFNFAKHYVNGHHVTKNFEVDESVTQEFSTSLDADKTPYTEADLVQNNDWIRSNIKSELFVDAFGQEEGLKVRAESDPEVLKALDLLPQARQLAENAKKIVAERNNASLPRQ